MAKAPQENGSPHDNKGAAPPSPETGAATLQLQWDIDCKRLKKILDDEDTENFLRVARQYVKPLA